MVFFSNMIQIPLENEGTEEEEKEEKDSSTQVKGMRERIRMIFSVWNQVGELCPFIRRFRNKSGVT